MKYQIALFFLLVAVLCWSCGPQQPASEASAMDKEEKSTTSDETSEWQPLFDGQTLAGWHNYLVDTIGEGWMVEDGTLALDPEKKGGDILTDGTYENFELQLEWKISACGNSGIMFNVNESPDYKRTYHTGPEMQVLDNTCHPDAKIETHRAGDLYDMIACSEETVKPAGEWNEVRLIVNAGKVEHWLNGKQVVTYEMFNEQWNEMVAKSKFKEWEGFGKFRRGRIALQDHSDKVWFRNIRIREL